MGNESLLAGKRYEVECETTGSRPPAVITWYKGRRRQLKHTKVRERSFLLPFSFPPQIEITRFDRKYSPN